MINLPLLTTLDVSLIKYIEKIIFYRSMFLDFFLKWEVMRENVVEDDIVATSFWFILFLVSKILKLELRHDKRTLSQFLYIYCGPKILDMNLEKSI
jgi:hypothetical protein